MGVVVPQVEGQNLTSTIEERGTGLIGGSPYIDEAADSYSSLIAKIVKAAEMEATLKRLLKKLKQPSAVLTRLSSRLFQR